MTGYGAGFSVSKIGTVNLEFQTVNGRYCDIQTNIPREYLVWENEAVKLIKSKISRGKVRLNVSITSDEEKKSKKVFSENLKNLICELKEIAVKTGIEPAGTLDTIINAHYLAAKAREIPGASVYKPAFTKALKQALDALIKSRAKEGKVLYSDICRRIKKIDSIRKKIIKLSPDVVKEFKARINKRLESLNVNSDIEFDPVRILTEVGLFSERVDVTEELVRLESHLQLFNSTLKSGGVVGKKLEFILQELFRETNTIGSKSGNSKISALVVSIKEELEKIREQVQNIE